MNDFQHELPLPAPSPNAWCRTGPVQDQDRTFTLHDPRGCASASISLPPLLYKMRKKEEQVAIKGWMSGFFVQHSHSCLIFAYGCGNEEFDAPLKTQWPLWETKHVVEQMIVMNVCRIMIEAGVLLKMYAWSKGKCFIQHCLTRNASQLGID